MVHKNSLAKADAFTIIAWFDSTLFGIIPLILFSVVWVIPLEGPGFALSWFSPMYSIVTPALYIAIIVLSIMVTSSRRYDVLAVLSALVILQNVIAVIGLTFWYELASPGDFIWPRSPYIAISRAVFSAIVIMLNVVALWRVQKTQGELPKP
jgi:hypothetical protein